MDLQISWFVCHSHAHTHSHNNNKRRLVKTESPSQVEVITQKMYSRFADVTKGSAACRQEEGQLLL